MSEKKDELKSFYHVAGFIYEFKYSLQLALFIAVNSVTKNMLLRRKYCSNDNTNYNTRPSRRLDIKKIRIRKYVLENRPSQREPKYRIYSLFPPY